MRSDSLNFYFWRKHLPTGRVSRGVFVGAQHPVFSDPGGFALRSIEKAAQELIDKWNRQQPETWRYSVDFEDWMEDLQETAIGHR